MIRQSPALDGPVPPEGQLPERISPFDLALYAAWADEDPGLEVAQVSRGSDAYIEGRIIERLDDQLVTRALPVLACAGRCRVETIAGFLECDPAALGASLAAQEWVDAEGDPPAHVAARPALARRLRRYFGADERRADYAARNAALAAALLTRLREAPLADIDVDELIAALRLSGPAEAAALWDSIAGRAMQPPGRWGTVLNMTRRILGEWEPGEWDAEDWPAASALRAAVTAAHIAASRRSVPFYEARGPWETVRDWATWHPDRTAARHLRARAALGLLPYARDDEQIREASDAISGFPRAAPEVAAGVADAAHRLLEAGRTRAARELGSILDSARALGASPLADAWADVARARLSADTDAAAAREYLALAERAAQSAADPEPSWPDWIPPDDLLARIRIERGLIAPPDDLSVLDEWESYAADRLDTIDGERLASLCLRIRLRHGVVAALAAERWEALDGYSPDRVPTCTAHDLVPPLSVSVAEAWMSAGQPDRAMRHVGRRRSAALGTRQDEVTVRHADAVAIKIARRLRLRTQRSLLVGQRRLDPLVRHDAWRAMAVIYREPPVLTEVIDATRQSPSSWHAWWQCQTGDAPAPVPPLHAPSAPTVDSADVAADIEEMRRLGHPVQAVVEQQAAAWLGQPARPRPPARSAEPYYDTRAAVRLAAVTAKAFTPSPGVPARLLGEMAFEEAELTALRLPDAADRLFQMAADAYERAGDHLGRVLAVASLSGFSAVQALAALTRLSPPLRAELSGRPQDAGSWRYWAERIQGRSSAVSPGDPPSPPGGPQGGGTQQGASYVLPPPGSPATVPGPRPLSNARPARTRVAVRVLAGAWVAALAGAAAYLVSGTLLVTATRPSTGGATHPVAADYLPLVIVVLLGVLGLLASRIPAITRLADDRGIGATRLTALQVEATAYENGLRLRARPRHWRGAPWPARPRLWLLRLAVRLAARARGRPAGYGGSWRPPDSPLGTVRVSWHGDGPDAGLKWWRRGRGTAPGLIHLARPDMTLTWERPLATALGPAAAGRIEWIRPVRGRMNRDPARPGPGSSSLLPAQARPPREVPQGDAPPVQSVLQGPSTWVSGLGDGYSVTSGPSHPLPLPEGTGDIDVQHVIGRAVATSAGPAMDVSGDFTGLTGLTGLSESEAPAGAGISELRGVEELRQGRPHLVVLQREPADATVSGEPPEDQAERLELAVGLVEDGAPAVLLLPVVPAVAVAPIAELITTAPVAGRGDVQRLVTALRKTIEPHVPPQVLDDVVLFLNEERFRPGNQ